VSDDSIKIELEYIKNGMDELKTSLTKLLERDEIKMQKINDVEMQQKLSEQAEMTCKMNIKKEFDAVHEKIRLIESSMPTVEKSRESMGKWVDFWLKLGAIIALISGAGFNNCVSRSARTKPI